MSDYTLRAAQTFSLLSLPVLIPQMLWVKRRTPLLPEAAGAYGEVQGKHPGVRLLVVGDSMAAGVGVDHHRSGFAGQLAERLSTAVDRSVTWRVIARSGATTRSTTRKLSQGAIGVVDTKSEEATSAPDAPPDLVVVVVGINDLLRFRRIMDWRHDIEDLITTIRRVLGSDVPMGFSGMPPVWRFPALPQPLRAVLGMRARLMDRVLRESVSRCDAFCVTLPVDVIADAPHIFFADDRFHPSARGYSEVATAFLPQVLDVVHAD
ncbi:SGNH/GDSL hydrolase family protein [Actinobacteria bacterium YIM 96077]|uniref:SGNH hydrolase-type esterase domain-containing protein n=1 Tax=Phytoactinopolyspora halophila TaxID=1981511 RepID=A0A329QJI4_9ACTN|nr:SGNH/GDSL hydrolase family protein [Phytoactinopolyspora halophila]AYY12613.1 SGNH/GDSL hydrolase family protein [Actinobacteria bacterium YIM 96077]RAW12484.1 hypothetical protein DPM12_13870 [Phytoactinopolyspora halophila]